MSGRPRLTEEAAAATAERVIKAATALRYRPSALPGMGFASDSEAAAFVFKRHRGRVGQLVGDTVIKLFPAENRIQLAVSLVLDHGLTHYRAGLLTKTNLTNIKRALPSGVAERAAARARAHSLQTQVSDANE